MKLLLRSPRLRTSSAAFYLGTTVEIDGNETFANHRTFANDVARAFRSIGYLVGCPLTEKTAELIMIDFRNKFGKIIYPKKSS